MVSTLFRSINVYTKPKILAILFLGFSSGLPLALVFSTLSVWLAEEGVSRTTIGLFAAAGTPYTLKFLWSPFIDSYRIPFLCKWLGRRRGWMVFSQACLAIAIIMMGFANPVASPLWVAIMALIVAFMSATQDIVIDAYRVELLDEEDQGDGAAMIVFGYRIGMLVSGAGALFLAEFYGWHSAYFIMGCLVSIGFITVMMTGEPEKETAIQQQMEQTYKETNYLVHFKKAILNPFKDFIKQNNWLLILLFVIAYKLGDAFAGIMTNPFFVELGFTKTEIASVNKIFGFVAVIAGSFIGGFLVKYVGLIRSLWICGILQMVTNLMFVLLAYTGHQFDLFVITIALENLAGGMGTAAFVAYLSSLCNIYYTATQYALLSSLASVGRTWLSASSGWIVDMVGWQMFFSYTVLAAIPGLLLLRILSTKLMRN